MLSELNSLKAAFSNFGLKHEAKRVDSLIEKFSAKKIVRPEGRRRQVYKEDDGRNFFIENPEYIPETEELSPLYEDQGKRYLIKAVHKNGVETYISLDDGFREMLLSAIPPDELGNTDLKPPYTYYEVYRLLYLLILSGNSDTMSIDEDTEKQFGKALMSIPQSEWEGQSDLVGFKVVEYTYGDLVGESPDGETMMEVDLTGEEHFPYGEDVFRGKDKEGRRVVHPVVENVKGKPPVFSPYVKDIKVLNTKKRERPYAFTKKDQERLDELLKLDSEYMDKMHEQSMKRFMEQRYPEDLYEGDYEKEIPIGEGIEEI